MQQEVKIVWKAESLFFIWTTLDLLSSDKSPCPAPAAVLFVKFHWQITFWGKSNANVAVNSILSHSQKPYPCLHSACFEYTRCKLRFHSPTMQIHRWVQFKMSLWWNSRETKRPNYKQAILLNAKPREDGCCLDATPAWKHTTCVMEVWKT